MTGAKRSSRTKILAAAVEVARESGAGNLSLDAVAVRAGVSKGGLLYNFPTKAALMRALVETFITEFEAQMNTAVEAGGGDLLSDYIRLSAIECEETKPGAAGVLAAMAEDPDFLKPIEAFKRRLLDRLKEGSGDFASVLLVFLALEGLRSLKLFEIDVLTNAERDAVIETMLERFGKTAAAPAAGR